jgi:excisionase family DNA binding protein
MAMHTSTIDGTEVERSAFSLSTGAARVPLHPGRAGTIVPGMDRLLTIEQAADTLRTGERFVRRLIAERRIRFHKIGRHVRISSTDLDDFIAAGVMEAVSPNYGRRRAAPTSLRRGA